MTMKIIFLLIPIVFIIVGSTLISSYYYSSLTVRTTVSVRTVNPNELLSFLKIFNLTESDLKPPYNITSSSIFNNTLVTFELPKSKFASKYVSIVVQENKLNVYLWNDTKNYILTDTIEKPTKIWSKTKIIYSDNKDNFTINSTITLAYYKVKIHNIESSLNKQINTNISEGGSVTILYASYTTDLYMIGGLVARVRAGGDFYINYGLSVVSVNAWDSGAWTYVPYISLCTSPPPIIYGQGTFSAGIWKDAGFALTDCPVTTAYAAWPNVWVDAWGNIVYPSDETPATKWIAPACGCSGISYKP